MYQLYTDFIFSSTTVLQQSTNSEKVLQYVYLTEGIQLRVHDVPGDGNCLYHCLYYFYKKYSLKNNTLKASFSSEQDLKKYLILYVTFYICKYLFIYYLYY